MLRLALRSIRFRPGRLVATLLAAFLGATVVMSFNSLHDTAGAAGVDDASAETLGLVAGIVGGYGTLLVFFAVASTLTVNVRQRQAEVALLRNTGATPAQIRRMLEGEAAAVALIGTVLGILPAVLGGQQLVRMLQDSGQVAEDVDPAFGPVALGGGFAITLIASVGAAFLAARRATRAAAGRDTQGGGRWRRIGAMVALLGGLASVATTPALDGDDPAVMAPAAYGAIGIALGLALLAGPLLRALCGVLVRLPGAAWGSSGRLAAHNLRARAERQAGILVMLTLFTGIATATLSMQRINNAVTDASGLVRSVDDKNLETVNLVDVGIVVVFVCVMLLNSLYADTSDRGREFGQQRMAGATPGQVLGTVALEGLILAGLGVGLGSLAGLAGILPYNLARTDTLLPHQGPGMWLLIALSALTVTLLTVVATTRRMLRTPTVEAVAVAA